MYLVAINTEEIVGSINDSYQVCMVEDQYTQVAGALYCEQMVDSLFLQIVLEQ